MREEDLHQLVGEGVAAQQLGRQGGVDRMVAEEFALGIKRFLDVERVYDILLGTVLNSYVAETEWHLLAEEHAACVDATIHDIDFSNDTHCADALGVEAAGHLERFRGGEICVGRDDAEDDGSGVADVVLGHFFGNAFDVVGLAGVGEGDARDARQVDHREIGAGGRVDIEHDGFVHDVLLSASHFVSELVDAISHFVKLKELLAWELLEHSPRPLGRVLQMHQTQLQRSPRHHTLASGQEIEPDDRLQHRRFA